VRCATRGGQLKKQCDGKSTPVETMKTMSAVKEMPKVAVAEEAAARPSVSLVTRGMDLLSSVRFGVVLLVLLAAACMAGMLIEQVNVEGFDKYYAELAPSQRLLYGDLGFFDIYHSWYFNALLLVLSLNIILSSIDFFPKAWTYVSRKKLDASAHWLRGQECHEEIKLAGESAQGVAEQVATAARGFGYKTRVSEKAGKSFVFAERGVWNRLGAYAVHVALLAIFVGGFLTAQYGHTGQMMLAPGDTSSEISETYFKLDQPLKQTVALPFDVECTDIQQKLIDRNGSTEGMNTLDWLTRIKIKDPERGTTEALVQLNKPYDYRGYRFFQASFIPDGKARSVKLRVTPEADGSKAEEVTIMRGQTAALADGTRIKFADFFSDFALEGGQADSKSPDYNNPAAALMISKTSGEAARAYAFPAAAASSGPVVGRAVAGYKFELLDFEKVGAAHVLSVQKDPGTSVVYLGFILLALTLAGVFFFAHQRVWAIVGRGGAGEFQIILGGNTNRNRLSFEDRFKRLVRAIEGGQEAEVQES
jgi:cytochrome c biogenesis protein